MNKQEYVDYLSETSEKVSPIILETIQSYEKIDKSLYDIIIFFVEKRLNRPLLKPALLRAAYEVCGGKSWKKIVPACVAYELINISSYQANASFDNKLGILTNLQKESQFIASMITREAAFKCLVSMEGEFDKCQLLEVSRCLSESNRFIYIAQHYDINLLTFDNYELYRDEKVYLKEYENRCYFGSGIFSGFCAYVGGILAGVADQKLFALKSFGEKYGLALHIINDIGDYVPAMAGSHIRREYQDQLSDFRNGRLTLPLYHFLMHGMMKDVELIVEMLRKKKDIDENIIFNLLLGAGSFDFAQNMANRFMGEAKNFLDSFEKNCSRDILSVMTSSIKSNKYHYAIRNAKSGL